MNAAFHKVKTLFRYFRYFVIRILTARSSPVPLTDCIILAPHPDDETFGCGQLIKCAIDEGKKVRIIILSDGAASHRQCCGIKAEELCKVRYSGALQALALLGVARADVVFMQLPDEELTSELPGLYEAIKSELRKIPRPMLLAPHAAEAWPDHLAATRLAEHLAEELHLELYYYCVWFYFSMPFRKFGRIYWRNARSLSSSVGAKCKEKAIEVYLSSLAPCGVPYAGKLPKELLAAVGSRKELYFKQ